jgi:hypothetical protein
MLRKLQHNFGSFKNKNMEVFVMPILQHPLLQAAEFHNHRYKNLPLNLTPKHDSQRLQVPIIFAVSVCSFVRTTEI